MNSKTIIWLRHHFINHFLTRISTIFLSASAKYSTLQFHKTKNTFVMHKWGLLLALLIWYFIKASKLYTTHIYEHLYKKPIHFYNDLISIECITISIGNPCNIPVLYLYHSPGWIRNYLDICTPAEPHRCTLLCIKYNVTLSLELHVSFIVNVLYYNMELKLKDIHHYETNLLENC